MPRRTDDELVAFVQRAGHKMNGRELAAWWDQWHRIAHTAAGAGDRARAAAIVAALDELVTSRTKRWPKVPKRPCDERPPTTQLQLFSTPTATDE